MFVSIVLCDSTTSVLSQKFHLDTFENAMVTARLRPMVPVVYNTARTTEQPIPRAEFTIDENESVSETSSLTSEFQAPGTAAADENCELQDDLQSTWFDSGELNVSAQVDVKPVVHVDGEDLHAFEVLFNEDQTETATNVDVDPLAMNEGDQENAEANEHTNDSTSMIPQSFISAIVFESTRICTNEVANNFVESVIGDDNNTERDSQGMDGAHAVEDLTNVASQESIANGTNAQVNNLFESNNREANAEENERERQIGENVANLLLHGQRVVFCDELELLHIPNQELKAIAVEPEYTVKAKDLLCGSKPFKEYVMLYFSYVLNTRF